MAVGLMAWTHDKFEIGPLCHHRRGELDRVEAWHAGPRRGLQRALGAYGPTLIFQPPLQGTGQIAREIVQQHDLLSDLLAREEGMIFGRPIAFRPGHVEIGVAEPSLQGPEHGLRVALIVLEGPIFGVEEDARDAVGAPRP